MAVSLSIYGLILGLVLGALYGLGLGLNMTWGGPYVPAGVVYGLGLGAFIGAVEGFVLGLLLGAALYAYTSQRPSPLQDTRRYRKGTNVICGIALVCLMTLWLLFISSIFDLRFDDPGWIPAVLIMVLLTTVAAFFGTNRVVSRVIRTATRV